MKQNIKRFILICAIISMPMVALAAVGVDVVADAGLESAAPATQPAAALVPALDLDNNPAGYASAAQRALAAGNWRLFAVLLGVALVWLARSFGGRWIPWLSTDKGGAALALAYAILLPLATIIAGGAPLTAGMLLGGILAAASSTGLYVWARKLLGISSSAADPSKVGPS